MKNKPAALKEFTLDFSKWCKGDYERDGKCCAWQQAKNANVIDETYYGPQSKFERDVIDINDAKMSRKDRIERLRVEFYGRGIKMRVKNANHGMKKV